MNEFFSRKKSSTKAPRPENKRVWASLAKEKEEVFKEMVHEGQGRTGGVKNAAFLCDGAKVLQDLAKKHLSHNWQAIGVSFLIILDIIHVLGYLWSAAYAFYNEGDHQVEAWAGKYLRMILEGKVSVVVSAIRRSATCRNLKGEKRKAVDKATEYFLNNKSYMKYDDYLKLGLPIASGVIEGTCKHLVKDRFEISGARWGLDGAEALLKLRAIYQSGDWQSYWNYHTACEHQRFHPKEHWKPLTDENSLPKLRVIQGGKSSKK
jgi:hypothetical protein